MAQDGDIPDEKKPPTPEKAWDDLEPDGRKLETLRDVRRALAFVCRRIEAGTIDHKTGHTLIMGFNTLGGLMQDARDSMWTKRARMLWDEREKAKASAEPRADH